MNHKPCNRCLISQPLDNYFKSKVTNDGREGICKSCVKARRVSKQKPIIYSITNLKNGMVYIGQTIKPLSERVSHHFTRAKDIAYQGNQMYRDMKESGYDRSQFPSKVVAIADNRSDLDSLEVKFIESYRLSHSDSMIYNLDTGGSSGKSAHRKTKISQSRSKLVKDRILAYSLLDGHYIGVFDTFISFYKSLNSKATKVPTGMNKNGYGLYKDTIIIYSYHSESEIKSIVDYSINNYKFNGLQTKSSTNIKVSGESNGASKHKESTVKGIIEMLIGGKTYTEIQEKLGVDRKFISAINNKTCWKYIVIPGYEDCKKYQS